MDEDGFVLFDCVFNKIENGFGGGIFGVEDCLVFQVHPLEGQVDHAAALPVVGHLLASAVYYVRDLVSHHELLVLSSKTVADEQAVLDLDRPYHIFGELLVLHHLLHLRLMLLVRSLLLSRVGLLASSHLLLLLLVG